MSDNRIYLRHLTVDDVTDEYHSWMNSPEVTRFLESRFRPLTKESMRDFVIQTNANPDVAFMAIVRKEDDRHIGNIKLGPIHWVHRLGEIGIVVGARDCWGKGYGTEAISLMCRHGFETLNLHKIVAGCYGPNEASRKAFLRAGFIQEAVLKQHNFFDGEFVDAYLFGMINPQLAQ